MADGFDRLLQFKINQFDIPVVSFSVASSLKRTIHEYRRVKGGKVEVHERGLYTFKMMATFHHTLAHDPPFWPDIIDAVHALYDDAKPVVLEWPSIGTVDVLIDSWVRSGEARVRSGEDVEFSCLETDFSRFLESKPGSDASRIDTAVYELQQRVDAIAQTLRNPFDAIFDIAASLENLRHNEFIDRTASTLDAMARTIEQVNATATAFEDPDNFEVLQAMHSLWDATIGARESAHKTVQEAPSKFVDETTRRFVVPVSSSITDISKRIYGSTQWARELLAINFIEDPLVIPAGFSILYVAR